MDNPDGYAWRIMSNQQWPPPGNQQNPWSQQDPTWRPPHFQDAQGRDPRQPFGQPPAAPPPSLEQLAPPKKPTSALVIVLAVIGVIAAVLIGMQFFGGPPSASPSPSPSAQAQPTETRTGNYIPFEGNGDGVFEIVSQRWESDGLHLRIRVEINTGEYGFALFAFTNDTRDSYDPIDPSTFTVSAGQPVERDVTFVMPRADSTIVLTTPSGRVALNALTVKG